MAKVVTRIALELQDGDEISLNHSPDDYSDWSGNAIVLEKTIDENDRVVLVVSVDPKTAVRSKVRPREEMQLPLFDISDVTPC
jgi:hypothetical protein